jgi:hypothetical protein
LAEGLVSCQYSVGYCALLGAVVIVLIAMLFVQL